MNSVPIQFQVENVTLTVNYYKEYLNFKIVELNMEKDYAKMVFCNRIISFNKLASNHFSQSAVLQLNLDNANFEKLYSSLKNKSKVTGLKRTENGISEFTVTDCNGSLICFRVTSEN